jgi:acyl-CoA thioester hydrolase
MKNDLDRRVYYHHTDAGGIVYYATYLHFLEEGRFEFLKSQGLDTGVLAKEGILFPVVHVSIDYKSPARYGDVIRILTQVERVGKSSVHFAQEIRRGETLLVKATTVWACIGNEFKTRPLPEGLRDVLIKLMQTGNLD